MQSHHISGGFELDQFNYGSISNPQKMQTYKMILDSSGLRDEKPTHQNIRQIDLLSWWQFTIKKNKTEKFDSSRKE